MNPRQFRHSAVRKLCRLGIVLKNKHPSRGCRNVPEKLTTSKSSNGLLVFEFCSHLRTDRHRQDVSLRNRHLNKC
jgi:hypothetical protein